MTDIAWSPELRLLVHASRAQPNPAFLNERMKRRSLEYPLDPAACRAKAESYWGAHHRIHRTKALLATGLAGNPPHWRPVVSAALARCAQPTVEIPLEVDVEAASVVFDLYPLFVAVPYWVTRGGVPFALRTLVRCHELTSYGKQHGYLDDRGDWIVEQRTRSLADPEDHPDEWQILRSLLAETSDTDYADARTIAAEALDRTASGTCWERGMQLWIPFAFPDEAAFHERGRTTALEIVEAISNQKRRGARAPLAVSRCLSVASIETSLEVLAKPGGWLASDDLLSIIAHRGLASGLQLIEASLDKWSTEGDRKHGCKLLFALRSPEVVELVARRFPHSKAVASAVAKYDKPPTRTKRS